MNQGRAKDVEILTELVQLVFDLLFQVGGFRDLVTKMNVHASLSGRKSSHRSYLALRPVYSCLLPIKQEMLPDREERPGDGKNCASVVPILAKAGDERGRA